MVQAQGKALCVGIAYVFCNDCGQTYSDYMILEKCIKCGGFIGMKITEASKRYKEHIKYLIDNCIYGEEDFCIKAITTFNICCGGHGITSMKDRLSKMK